MSLELRVLERTEGKVLINYEELKGQLALELQKYKGLTFSEEQLTEAKKTRANLNKVAKAIDDRRKEEKQAFLKGFEVFENQTKELTNMVKDVSNEIDSQVKAFEDKEKEDKKFLIEEFWLENGYEKIELKQIWDDKWLNKGFSLKDIQEEITTRIAKIEQELEEIAFLCGEEKEKAFSLQTKYLIHLDKGRVIFEYQQEEKAKELLRKTKEQPKEEIKEEEQEIQVGSVEEAPIPEEQTYVLQFKVYGNALELKTLSRFLKENNYKYERV